MKTNLPALGLILFAALWRVAIVYHPAWFNIAPITALAFCGAAYFRDWRLCLIPFAALMLSDLWLNHYYATEFGSTWSVGPITVRLACFAAAVGIGRLVSRRRSFVNLLIGTLSCAFVFYLLTNTAAWFGDAYYPKNSVGWWQALTAGHPEFPPTLWFFRHTLFGDVLFTAIFVCAMEAAAKRTPIASAHSRTIPTP